MIHNVVFVLLWVGVTGLVQPRAGFVVLIIVGFFEAYHQGLFCQGYIPWLCP